jgi:CelD/BcsL family acetyltransferase involved in cellulose biosynthesis
VVDFCNLPESSPTHQILPELASREGFSTRQHQEDVCPVIELPASWDEYLASLRKKDRHETRRKLRRLNREANHRWYRVENPGELSPAIDTFIRLHRQSSTDKHQFMDDAMADFFRGMAETLLPTGWLWLSMLDVEDKPVSGLLSFDYGNRIWVYNSGFDPEYQWLSPGVVTKAFAIQEAISKGRAFFDFLQGDEPYKYRFGAQDTKVIRMLTFRGQPPEE